MAARRLRSRVRACKRSSRASFGAAVLARPQRPTVVVERASKGSRIAHGGLGTRRHRRSTFNLSTCRCASKSYTFGAGVVCAAGSTRGSSASTEQRLAVLFKQASKQASISTPPSILAWGTCPAQSHSSTQVPAGSLDRFGYDDRQAAHRLVVCL